GAVRSHAVPRRRGAGALLPQRLARRLPPAVGHRRPDRRGGHGPDRPSRQPAGHADRRRPAGPGRARARRVSPAWRTGDGPRPRHRRRFARRRGRRAARLDRAGQRCRAGRASGRRRAGPPGRDGTAGLLGSAGPARSPPSRGDPPPRVSARRPRSLDLGHARLPSVSLALAVTAASCHLRTLRPRLPFRYGAVTVTHFPLLHLALDVEVADGRRARGFAADSLPPKWFDKDPARSFRAHVEALLAAIRLA